MKTGIIMAVIQMWKLKFRNMKQLGKDHPANKWKSWNWTQALECQHPLFPYQWHTIQPTMCLGLHHSEPLPNGPDLPSSSALCLIYVGSIPDRIQLWASTFHIPQVRETEPHTSHPNPVPPRRGVAPQHQSLRHPPPGLEVASHSCPLHKGRLPGSRCFWHQLDISH